MMLSKDEIETLQAILNGKGANERIASRLCSHDYVVQVANIIRLEDGSTIGWSVTEKGKKTLKELGEL